MCMHAAWPSTVRAMVFPRFPSPPLFYFMPTDLVGGGGGGGISNYVTHSLFGS